MKCNQPTSKTSTKNMAMRRFIQFNISIKHTMFNNNNNKAFELFTHKCYAMFL